MMLEIGAIVKIGGKQYTLSPDIAEEPCVNSCAVRNCTSNKEFLLFKKEYNAETCLELTGIGTVFKEC